MPVITSVSYISPYGNSQRTVACSNRRPKTSFSPGVRTLFVCAFCSINIVLAGDVWAQLESSSFPVAQMDETTRSMALGGRSPALLSSDASALFANAALLNSQMQRTVSISYLNHLAGISSGSIAYATSVDSLTSAGIGVRYLSFGSIDRADELGNRDGTFSASDLDIALSGSRGIAKNLRVGMSIHFLNSSLDDESASALSLDGGLVYELPDRSLAVALVVQQVGITMSSIGRSNAELPLDVRVGVTKKLAHVPLLLSISFYRLNELGEAPDDLSAFGGLMYHTILGGEFQFSRNFQIRIGYNFRRHDELGLKSRLDFSGVSTGFGVRVSKIGIDYGFSSWSSIGGLHRFSIRTRL